MREKENLNLTRKRSTNILSNTNKLTISTINQKINNKNKQWNLYDQKWEKNK